MDASGENHQADAAEAIRSFLDETSPAATARTQQLSELLDLVEVIHHVGVTPALKLVMLGLRVRTYPILAELEIRRYVKAFEALAYMFEHNVWQETAIDRLLAFTYLLLSLKIVDWSEAAEIASLRLGRAIKGNAWRMRVSRWAAARGAHPIRFRGKSGQKFEHK